MFLIRILHIGMTSNKGGLESFIMNVYRNIDRNLIQFDFLAMHGTKVPYEDEINSLGGKVYYIIYPKKDVRRIFKPITGFLKDKKYHAVHYHRTHLGDLNYLWQAKAVGIPMRIVHAHSSGYISSLNVISKLSEKINKRFINSVSTDLIACSHKAGKWMFGDNKYEMLPNAINLEDYTFSFEKRKKIRENYNVMEDDVVLGHVGSFFDVKNHDFIIDMFYELTLNSRKNYKLMLIGDGINFHKIKHKVSSLKIEEKVLFLGSQRRVDNIINAFDVFILPSKFEGLPISSIEAQANGLPSLLSDQITKEIVISKNTKQLAIDHTELWTETINNMDLTRLDNMKQLESAGYDIKEMSKKLEQFYLSNR